MERARTETIRELILDLAAVETRGIARRVAEVYGISRQAANRHLDLLVEAGLLEQSGRTRARWYRLRRTSSLSRELRVTPVLNPDRVWEDHIAAILSADRPAVRDLCRGAFAELIRNAVRHADASWITLAFSCTARDIALSVSDDGRGIFSVIAPRVGATSARDAADAIARLARARASESPATRLVLLARHFETFRIGADGLALTFDRGTGSWTLDGNHGAAGGTSVGLTLLRSPVRVSIPDAPDERVASSA